MRETQEGLAMRRTLKALLMVAIAVGVGVATVYAAGSTMEWFKATNTTSNDGNYAQLMSTRLHMTNGADVINFSSGDDNVYLSTGDDELNMGPDSDTLDFYAESGDVEQIVFNDDDSSYIKYTESDDEIEIKSDSGDVIITLGD